MLAPVLPSPVEKQQGHEQILHWQVWFFFPRLYKGFESVAMRTAIPEKFQDFYLVSTVRAEFMGKTAYAEIRVEDPALYEDIAVENTSNVSIVKGDIRVDPASPRFVQQVTVTQTSAWPLSQP